MFAALAQRAGVREVALSLDSGATVRDALTVLVRLHPAVADLAGRMATAVNTAYVAPTFFLSEGDELALIPPVSGG